jgi:hypothetical protein
MCIGALVCIFLPDSPVKARRFTDAEKVAALLRTKNNQRYFFQTPECPFALANLRSGTQNAHLKKEQVGIVNP